MVLVLGTKLFIIATGNWAQLVYSGIIVAVFFGKIRENISNFLGIPIQEF